MKQLKFKPGDRVKLKDNITEEQNSNQPILKGRILIVNHYHNPWDVELMLWCNIYNEEPDIYPIYEYQLENI